MGTVAGPHLHQVPTAGRNGLRVLTCKVRVTSRRPFSVWLFGLERTVGGAGPVRGGRTALGPRLVHRLQTDKSGWEPSPLWPPRLCFPVSAWFRERRAGRPAPPRPSPHCESLGCTLGCLPRNPDAPRVSLVKEGKPLGAGGHSAPALASERPQGELTPWSTARAAPSERLPLEIRGVKEQIDSFFTVTEPISCG